MKLRSLAFMVVVALVAGLFVVPVAAQDGPTLTIWTDDTRSGPLTELGEAFEEENGIAVEVVELPFGEIRDQMKTAAPAGEGPDLIIGAHDWLGELVLNGLLEPIELDDKEDLFLESAINAFTYEGELYGVPYAVENVAFVRNTDLVPEAPETWDDVREISAELVESGESEYGYVIQENDPYHFFPVQTAFGGYVFGFDEGEGYNPQDVGIDNEGSIEALSWLSDYVEAGLMPAGLDYGSMHQLFFDGDAAMMITGPWAITDIETSGVPYAVSAIPGTEDVENGRPFLGVQGFMVNSFSENKQLASLFLTEYIATEDAMQAIFDAGDRPSAFIPVRENTESEVLTSFGEAGVNGLAMPAIPEMSAVWSSWGNAVALVVQGSADAQTAFEDAATTIRDSISEATEEEAAS